MATFFFFRTMIQLPYDRKKEAEMQGSPFRISLLLSFHLFSLNVRMCSLKSGFKCECLPVGIQVAMAIGHTLETALLNLFYEYNILKISAMSMHALKGDLVTVLRPNSLEFELY